MKIMSYLHIQLLAGKTSYWCQSIEWIRFANMALVSWEAFLKAFNEKYFPDHVSDEGKGIPRFNIVKHLGV